MGYTDYIVIALLAVSVVLNIITFVTNSKNKNLAEKFADLENDVKDYMDRTQRDTVDSVQRQLEMSSKASTTSRTWAFSKRAAWIIAADHL